MNSGANNLPPIEISNFHLIEPIGQGGMGVVWLGQQERPNRKVAVKIVAPGQDIPPALLELLRQEGDIAAQFQHAHLATVYECGLIDDHYYMAMELLSGGDLEDRIRAGLNQREAIEVARNIASGLAHIHAKGFVHRDLKPANVLFTEDGRAVLTDFGISKAMDTEGLMTRLGYTTGTPTYMSPEQITGQPLDGRSDLYALGILLFEMLSGRLPFNAESDHRLKELHLNESPPRLPEELSRYQETLDRLLAKNPEQRFEDAEALIRALNRLTEFPEQSTRVIEHANRLQPTEATTRTAPATWFQQMSRSRVFWIVLAIVVAMTILVSGRVLDISNTGKTVVGETIPAKTSQVPSVAVLPFSNMSSDQEQEYFADGLSDTLIHVLAQVSGLKVTAKTSSFYFKGKNVRISEIAEELQVAHVLEGSVQKSGNQIRVITQLVNVGDGTHLWSRRFDRELKDIFAVQDEIAQEVVKALKVTLLDAEEQRLAQRYQPTLEAYGELILGRQEMAKRTATSLAAAEFHFKQAIELDSGYALAYIGLADSYMLQATYSGLVRRESRERRQPLIEKALELDSLSSEAYTARAQIQFELLEYNAAEGNFLRAIELNPNYASARHWYAILLGAQGRFEEELAQLRVAAELDPMSPIIQTTLSRSVWNVGRIEEALRLIRRNIERNPELPNNYSMMAIFQSELGQLGKAQRWNSEARKRNPAGPGNWLRECVGFLHLGDALAAEDCAKQFSAFHPEKIEARVVWVQLHIYREQWSAAVKGLESILERFPGLELPSWRLANLLARQGRLQRARQLMAEVFPAFLEDQVNLAETDLKSALVFAAILHANGESKQRDVLLNALDERVGRMHRTRGFGFGTLDVSIHALRGDRDRAIASLREAIDMGWRAQLAVSRQDFWWVLRQDWKLQTLLQDPEFIGLMNELEADIVKQRLWYEENKDKPLI